MICLTLSVGTHWVWEILVMLTRGSAETRLENKLEQQLEMGFDVQRDVDPSERPRVLNAHLRTDDMPTPMMENKRLGCQ